MVLPAAEIGAMFFHTLSNCIGLVGNGLLLYLVATKSSKSIRTYSVLNFALTDFFGCLFALFVQQRIIAVGMTSLAYISSGPCKYLGPLACYVGYSFMLHCYAHTLWRFLLSFLYRFYVLRSKSLTVNKLICILLGFYSISLFQFANDPEVIVAMLQKRFPDYAVEGHCISGTVNIIKFDALFTILHMTLPVSPIYLTIIWIRSKNIVSLQAHKMSDNTRTLHRQLLNALTFQAILPGLFLIAVITYALGQFGIANHPLLEYTTFLVVGALPVMSPLGTLYFIRPYHNWIKKNVLKQEVVEPSGVQATNVPSTLNGPSTASLYKG